MSRRNPIFFKENPVVKLHISRGKNVAREGVALASVLPCAGNDKELPF